MFFDYIFPVLNVHLHIIKKLGSCPLIWNNVSNRAELRTSQKFVLFTKLHFWFMNLYLVFLFINLPSYWNTVSFSRFMMSSLFLCGSGLFSIFRYSVTLNALDFAKLLNSIPILEQSRGMKGWFVVILSANFATKQ